MIFGPVLVEADDGFEAFDSIEGASGAMEAIDVRNGIYQVFDARGTYLTLTTRGYEVLISEDENELADPDALAERLREYLARVSAHLGETRFLSRYGDVDLKHDSLERLLAVIVEATSQRRNLGGIARIVAAIGSSHDTYRKVEPALASANSASARAQPLLAVSVSTVRDCHDLDDEYLIENSIDHAVFTPAGRVKRVQGLL